MTGYAQGGIIPPGTGGTGGTGPVLIHADDLYITRAQAEALGADPLAKLTEQPTEEPT